MRCSRQTGHTGPAAVGNGAHTSTLFAVRFKRPIVESTSLENSWAATEHARTWFQRLLAMGFRHDTQQHRGLIICFSTQSGRHASIHPFQHFSQAVCSQPPFTSKATQYSSQRGHTSPELAACGKMRCLPMACFKPLNSVLTTLENSRTDCCRLQMRRHMPPNISCLQPCPKQRGLNFRRSRQRGSCASAHEPQQSSQAA
mmetsp:Transcript_139497/g.246538  ORF Transcript_139497/g.246538 Transcript_139497/m.246538 type:complete len:200 (-) Transcript_139497:452-1051(-)